MDYSFWFVLFLFSSELIGCFSLITDRFVLENIDDTHFDNNGRLVSHWLFVSDNVCLNDADISDLAFRKIASVSGSLADNLFGSNWDKNSCHVVNVGLGTDRNYIAHPLPEDYKRFAVGEDITSWIKDRCFKAEIGFVSFRETESIVYWVDSYSRRKQEVGRLKYGERFTLWQGSFIGHEFEVVDATSSESIRNVTVLFHTHVVVGDSGTRVHKRNVHNQVQQTFEAEWNRAHRVKRTFTDLGFALGKLPLDLYSSMRTYYYNNREEYFREEWDTKGGVHVNWWEVDANMIGMPWELKKYWQRRLQTLVEAWTGEELELTDIYGMRRYNDGARLLTHVDREETHAASLIINVAQHEIREPWYVEIYDFADRLHEIEMHEGDIVYYESARCLHGRMKPLQGAFYVNLFAHYRPVGDPKWFLKENPEGSPAQLHDIGVCTNTDGRASCTSDFDLPFLSPSLEKVSNADDLFQYWKRTEGSISSN